MANEIEVEFTDHSEEILRAMNDQVRNIALKAIGETAEGYAKDNCPVDTGRLRNSITYATSSDHSSGTSPAKAEDYETKSTPQGTTLCVGTNVEYASEVEFGNRPHKVGRAHFLRDSIADHGEEFEKILEAALKS